MKGRVRRRDVDLRGQRWVEAAEAVVAVVAVAVVVVVVVVVAVAAAAAGVDLLRKWNWGRGWIHPVVWVHCQDGVHSAFVSVYLKM